MRHRRPPPTALPFRRRRPRLTPAQLGLPTPPASPSTPPPSSVWRPAKTRASASSSLTTTRSARKERGRLGLNETGAGHCSGEHFEEHCAVNRRVNSTEIMTCLIS